MDTKLQQKLYEDFEQMFSRRGESVRELIFGIEVDDGWEPIVRNMCGLIHLHSKRSTFFAKKKQLFSKYTDYAKLKLHNLCRKIENLLRLKPYRLYNITYRPYEKYAGWHIEFTQIKEKFGTLRAYYTIVPNFEPKDIAHLDDKEITKDLDRFEGFVDGVIAYATLESSITCETHGKPGKLRSSGWWKVECDECKKHE